MKTMLIMLLISICLIGWRGPQYLEMAGLIPPDPVKQEAQAKELAAAMAKEAAKNAKIKPMTAEEFARLQKTDPKAYQKFIDSYQKVDRGEADKLVNFLKSGKYE